MNVLRPTAWTGIPNELAELVILRKNGGDAVCRIMTHQFG